MTNSLAQPLPSANRRAYIDWARGLAVLLMLEVHVTDAWTSPAAKETAAFRNAAIVGGFAAPLFLWLAGLAVPFAVARTARRAGNRAAVRAICRRGLEILVLAFLFRLQAFLITPGSPPVALLRVDILNIMGPAIAVAGLAWGWSSRTLARVAIYGAMATSVAMVTPVVRAAPWVDPLPAWLQWYVRPSGEHTTFTLFPWVGFVFGGAAVGALLARTDRRVERRLHLSIAAAGAVVVALGFYMATRPSLYSSVSFWTSSPTWFAIRVGILMMVVMGISGLEPVGESPKAQTALASLQALGRSSLFIYWIHVELVYGYATWVIHRRLPLWGSLTAAVLFSVTMYGAVALRERLARGWHARSGEPQLA